LPERRLVAIHQPNFLPWLGFFDKIRRADVFVALDNVQFPKTGGTWTNRVKLLVAGVPAWTTVPIVRAYHGTKTIAEMEINNHLPWREKLMKTLELNYGRAPHFQQVYPWLADLIGNTTTSLRDYNLNAIHAIMKAIRLETRLVLGSTLGVETSSTRLLIDTVHSVGGNAYLAGGGAAEYQEDDLFADSGVELVYQRFDHPAYPQFNVREFVPGLSIVDALMNCGFEGTSGLIQQGHGGGAR
jgi:hypothetical protein